MKPPQPARVAHELPQGHTIVCFPADAASTHRVPNAIIHLKRLPVARRAIMAVVLLVIGVADMVAETLYPGLRFQLSDYDNLANLEIARDKARLGDSDEVRREVVVTGDGNRISIEIVVGSTADSGEGWLVARSSLIGVMPKANPNLGRLGCAHTDFAMFSRANVFVSVLNKRPRADGDKRPDMEALALQIDAKILESGAVDAVQLEKLKPKAKLESRYRKLGKGKVRTRLDLTPLPNQSKLTVIGDDDKSKHLRFDHRNESELWLRSWPEHPVRGLQSTVAVVHVINEQLLATIEVDTDYDDFPRELPKPRIPRPEKLTRAEIEALLVRLNNGEFNRKQFMEELRRMERGKAAKFGITKGPRPVTPPSGRITQEEVLPLLDRQANGELTKEQVLEEVRRMEREKAAKARKEEAKTEE